MSDSHKQNIKGSQLVIYPDGTLYHIDLKKSDNIPPNLLFVGSAERVNTIAEHFDAVTFKHRNEARPEFYIASGTYKGLPVAAFSCGIGVDNVEIVMNEFHALFEYNPETSMWGEPRNDINIIRVGTAGSSLPDLALGALTISEYSIGLDNLGAYYPALHRSEIAQAIEQNFLKTRLGEVNPLSYCAQATPEVARAVQETAKALGEKALPWIAGITTASPGFFAPEGRKIGRLNTALRFEEFLTTIQNFNEKGLQIVNHEMETSALFRLGYEILGYNVGAICVVLDNLATDAFIEKDTSKERMHICIEIALETLLKLVK